jgi:hypothetical protein
MSILKLAETTQAYLKCNIYGWAGAGKTYAAVKIALGLSALTEHKKPIAFLDSETGSDFWIERISTATGHQPLVAKTRAFADLIQGIIEAQDASDILIADSATHYWRELIDAYKKARKMPPDGKLAFQHWDHLKGEWRRFTDLFVNSSLHMIVCGRAGHEWDYFENDEGKMELRKTGTKMKAEAEFGFEPSLVLECERINRSIIEENAKAKGLIHRVTVLKDRWDIINGREFDFDPMQRNDKVNPEFDALAPHIRLLNLGGIQMGVDISRESSGMFRDGRGDYERRKREHEIVLEALAEHIGYALPGQSAEEKKRKKELLQLGFGTMAWKSIETKPTPELRAGFRAIVNKINEWRESENLEPIDMPSEAREVESEVVGDEQSA